MEILKLKDTLSYDGKEMTRVNEHGDGLTEIVKSNEQRRRGVGWGRENISSGTCGTISKALTYILTIP